MTEHPRVFAVGDLHLPGGSEKPMDVFGSHWEDHFDKISAHWTANVTPSDIVLIPGDISWAMQIADAMGDLSAIGRLPGRKLLIRGNHDYWWSSISRLRAQLPQGMYALQNDALKLDGLLFCGSRGWVQPASDSDEENGRIYSRELMRMALSLQAARRISTTARLIALTHFPPADGSGKPSPMTRLFEQYGVSDVVYGHLHAQALDHAFRGSIAGVRYHCVSCDSLGFQLYALPDAQVGD